MATTTIQSLGGLHFQLKLKLKLKEQVAGRGGGEGSEGGAEGREGFNEWQIPTSQKHSTAPHAAALATPTMQISHSFAACEHTNAHMQTNALDMHNTQAPSLFCSAEETQPLDG